MLWAAAMKAPIARPYRKRCGRIFMVFGALCSLVLPLFVSLVFSPWDLPPPKAMRFTGGVNCFASPESEDVPWTEHKKSKREHTWIYPVLLLLLLVVVVAVVVVGGGHIFCEERDRFQLMVGILYDWVFEVDWKRLKTHESGLSSS